MQVHQRTAFVNSFALNGIHFLATRALLASLFFVALTSKTIPTYATRGDRRSPSTRRALHQKCSRPES